MSNVRTMSLILAAVGILAISSAAWGEMIISHSGDTNPVFEGWTEILVGNNVSVGPVLNDAGPGLHAWLTYDKDTGTAPKASAYYQGQAAVTAQQWTDAATKGWSMKATLRVDDFLVSGFDETPGLVPGIQMAFVDPGLWILFALGSDDNGNTTMTLKGNYVGGQWGPTETATISGSGYNDYELLWDPTDGLDLIVNGSTIVDNYDCSTDFAGALGNRLYWGCTDTGGKGAGYWTNVEFASVPEPSTIVMLVLGSLALLMGRRRK